MDAASNERLLHGNPPSELWPEHENIDNSRPVCVLPARKRRPRAYSIVFHLSLTLNIILIFFIVYPISHSCDVTLVPTKYAGLIRDTPIKWNPRSAFGTGNENETDRSILWESLDTSAGEIALEKAWAQARGLPPSRTFPWDDSRSTYLLNAHHSLHCLSEQRKVRRYVTIAYHNGTQLDGYRHLVHCMDHLLQNILCDADDTPMYTTDNRTGATGIGQVRMCRGWDKLTQWADSQTACFAYVNETQGVREIIQRFRYYPRGSPFSERMRRRLGFSDEWFEERPRDIESMPPYWRDFSGQLASGDPGGD